MSIALPSSTLALLCGNYDQSEEISVQCARSSKEIPVTCYAPPSVLQPFAKEFLHLAGSYLVSASRLLGEYPFARLDLVLMPRCFACLGLERYRFCFEYSFITDNSYSYKYGS